MKSLSLIAAIIILTFSVQSCRTKKKVIGRETIKIEKVVRKKVEEKTVKEEKTDSVVNMKSETLVITENKDIELTQGDPNKKIIVEDSKGNKIVYTGANVVIKNRRKEETKKDTSSIALTKIDKSKTNKSEAIKKEESASGKKRSSDSYVKTTPTIIGVGIGIGLIGLLVFLYLRRKKKSLIG